MSRWRSTLLRSTVFRISLINAALLLLTMVAAFAGAWIATTGSIEKEARERIVTEGNALSSEKDKEGLEGAASAIMWRDKRPGALNYLLVDKSGRILAGNMTSVPLTEGWHHIRVRGPLADISDSEILARTIRHDDGTVIAIGENIGKNEAARAALFMAVVPIGAGALFVCLALSLILTRRTFRRMDELTSAFRQVEAGDLSARVLQARSDDDDITELGIALNRMLDRVEELVSAVRRVSAEVSHDLRTPLTHALHATDNLSQAKTDDERAAAVSLIRASLSKALNMFASMLMLAEVDAGVARTGFVPINLCELLDEVLNAYEAEIEASGRALMSETTE